MKQPCLGEEVVGDGVAAVRHECLWLELELVILSDIHVEVRGLHAEKRRSHGQ